MSRAVGLALKNRSSLVQCKKSSIFATVLKAALFRKHSRNTKCYAPFCVIRVNQFKGGVLVPHFFVVYCSVGIGRAL